MMVASIGSWLGQGSTARWAGLPTKSARRTKVAPSAKEATQALPRWTKTTRPLVSIYLSIYLSVYIYIYVYTYIQRERHVYTYIYIYIHIHVYIYIHTYISKPDNRRTLRLQQRARLPARSARPRQLAIHIYI